MKAFENDETGLPALEESIKEPAARFHMYRAHTLFTHNGKSIDIFFHHIVIHDEAAADVGRLLVRLMEAHAFIRRDGT